MSAKVLKNGTVLSFDDSTEKIKVLDHASILIVGDRIAAIEDDFDDLPDVARDAEIIDVQGKIVCPGFVNTHVHTWQSVYRTLGPNVTLASYLQWLSQMSPTATKSFTPDDIYISALEGYLEGINGGITSFVDHAHNNWDHKVVEPGYDAAVDSGARVWWCYDIAPREGFSEDDQWQILNRIAARDGTPETVLLGLSLDIVHANGRPQDTLAKATKINAQALTMHCMGGGPWPLGSTTSPVDICKHNWQATGLPIIFSHAPYLNEEEMQTLRDHDLNVSITPESECHYGHGQFSGPSLSDQASLGVDTAWTFSGDLITQARLWLQIVRNTRFEPTLKAKLVPRQNPMEVEQAFLLATRQGGRALKRKDIGVIQVGAKADVVVFNGDLPHMLGWSDPVAAVVLHANTGDIEHVLVGGQFRKRDFKLLVDDNIRVRGGWSGVKSKFMEASKRIQAGLKTEPALPEKMFGVAEFGDVEIASTIRH